MDRDHDGGMMLIFRHLALLTILAFASGAHGQITTLATPVEVGPVSVKLDTESISSIDWANAGQGITFALRMDVLKVGGGFEPFTIRPYTHGLSLEYAGLVEWMTEDFSLRNNRRYTHLQWPRSYGGGPRLWLGDAIDTSALRVQMTGILETDEADNFVIDPDTGQPRILDQWADFTTRTFRGEYVDGQLVGGLPAGGMRFTNRCTTCPFQFRTGALGAEVLHASIGPDGLIVGGVNYTTLIASLKARLDALEQSNNQ